MTGAPLQPGQAAPAPGSYGLYLADQDWQTEDERPAPKAGLRLLFDDPDFVDAEPVAVYARPVRGNWPDIPATPAQGEARPEGPAGRVESSLMISVDQDLPGQATDTGARPIFDEPPAGAIDHVRIYASRRDRFDDPVRPRVEGGWGLVAEVPVKNGFSTWLPAGVPMVLAGFDRDGRVARWTTAARDSQGRQATFYAFAGDHYSGTRPGVYQFCNGCHPGHSILEKPDHAERLP
jgi:hypothetical protein